MQRSNELRAVDPTNIEVRTPRTRAEPYPGRLRSSRRVRDEAEAAACPWRVQPCRKQGRKPGVSKVSTAETETKATEALS